ncbi:acyl-CoA dehydrogenase family protein [Kitasatospora terrestris]|uniref:Acyl-CoA dehydrogenase family protein n=1 Tax=Kitasatospora terrestris TaxID=258051 RepID=A0ABP9DG14_9ACTN
MTPTAAATNAANAANTAAAAVHTALVGLPRVVDLLAARAEEHDREGTFPYQGIEVAHEAGLLTLTVGPRHGGAGLGLLDTVQLLSRLARGDASVALLTAQTLLLHAEQARTAAWPAGLYRRLLTESRRGPALVATVRAAAAVTAERDAEGWLLTGRLTGVPGAEALAWLAVLARTAGPEPHTGLFLIRGDSPGVEIDPNPELLGLRATAAHDVLLDAVRVGPGAAVGLTPADGPPGEAARTTAAWRDLALAAVQLGTALAARDWLVRHLRQAGPVEGRGRLGLAELECSLIGAEELLYGVAARVDRADATALDRTGAARLLVDRTVATAVQQAVTLAGAAGLSRRHPLERHLRDALSARAYALPEELVLERLARSVVD